MSIEKHRLALLDCQNGHEAFKVIAAAFAELGFEQAEYSYAALTPDPGSLQDFRIERLVIIQHTMSPEGLAFYTGEYNDKRLFERNPALVPFYHGNRDPFYSGLSYVELGMQDVTPKRLKFLQYSAQFLPPAHVIVPVMMPETSRLPSGSITAYSSLTGSELKKQTAAALKCIPELTDLFLKSVLPLTHDILAQDINLTSREHECLQFICNGFRTIDIAERLDLSKSMIDRHVASARKKLRSRTLPEAIARGVALKILVR